MEFKEVLISLMEMEEMMSNMTSSADIFTVKPDFPQWVSRGLSKGHLLTRWHSSRAHAYQYINTCVGVGHKLCTVTCYDQADNSFILLGIA